MIDVTRLRQKRQRKLDEMSEIIQGAENEDRGLNEQEQQRYDALEASVNDLDGRIERAERSNQREQEMRQSGQQPAHQRQQPSDQGQEGPQDPSIGMSDRERRQYSLIRAIRAQMTGNWQDAGLEADASRAVAEQVGREPQGFFVPFDVLSHRDRGQGERRDLNVGTPTAGGNLVSTDLLAQNFIDLLRNRMMVRQAGATILTGLMGDVAIPRQTGGATAYWVAAGNAPTESQQTVDQVALSPETVGAFTDYHRRLMLQSSIDVEQFVRADLTAIIALAIDYAALHGSGNSNQPQGLENVGGIGSVVGGTDGAAPDWDDIINLETEVAIDNADLGRLAYMTNARVRGKLKRTEKFSGTNGNPIWENNNTPVNGYMGHVTNQVRSNITKNAGSNLSAIFFGNWADLLVAFWSGLDILVDPYTHSTSGTIRVVALQDCDIAVRHPESFSAMLDAVTT